MRLERSSLCPVMCLTQDGLGLSHVEQTQRLCAAGARWVQLRMKDAPDALWTETAMEACSVCRRNGAVFIVNDSIDVALACGADGVHLGSLDPDWTTARERLGSGAVIGGTVNNASDALRAVRSGCLDYVGLGPLRSTPTKKNLAPVLGLEGIRPILSILGDLPAWVIGGAEAGDLPDLLAAGAAGVAVSSCLYRNLCVEENYRPFSQQIQVAQTSLPP